MTEIERDSELLNIRTKLERISDLLLGDGLKDGWISEHRRLMKSTFGDDANPTESPGLVRDVKGLQDSKAWITHSFTAVVSSLGTAILGGFGYWLFHK